MSSGFLQLDAFWHYGFMERALVAGWLMSVACGMLSPFVVLRRLSFSADGLAHASIGGLAMGLLLFETGPVPGLASYATSFMFTCGVGVAIAYFSSGERLEADTAVGVCFVAAFALGILMLSLRHFYTANLEDFLFGSILAVNVLECRLLLGLAVVIAVGCGSCWRWLGAWTFDEELARASGVPTGWLRYGLLAVVAATVVLSVKVVGALLVTAMLILPGAVGTLVANSMRGILLVSVATAAAGTLAGMVVSNATDAPPGPGAVLSSFVLFATVFFLRKIPWRPGGVKPGHATAPSAKEERSLS